MLGYQIIFLIKVKINLNLIYSKKHLAFNRFTPSYFMQYNNRYISLFLPIHMELYTKSYASYQSIKYLLGILQKNFEFKKSVLPKNFRKGLDEEKTTYASISNGQLMYLEPVFLSSKIRAVTLISLTGSEKNAKSLARILERESGISQEIVPVPELEGIAAGRLAGFLRIYRLETGKFQQITEIIRKRLDDASVSRKKKK